MNVQDIKGTNRGLVLRLLCCGEASSRIDVARLSGLSKMAVGNITAQLIEEGILCETQLTDNSKVGRNPMGLALSPTAPCVLGLYIARDAVYAARADMYCRLEQTAMKPLADETTETLRGKIVSLLTQVQRGTNGRRILGIGVASIGPIDCEEGVILCPANFFGIKNFSVKALLVQAFGLSVFLNNDMNAAALAEFLFAPQHETEFLYLGMTNGVGAGIVSGGRLYQNNGGFSGEIGHMSIHCNGPRCACGQRGCLELYVGIPAILEQLRAATGQVADTAEAIAPLAQHPRAAKVMAEVADKLAYGLVGAINLLNPNSIVLGHEGVYLPDSWLEQLQQQLNTRIFAHGYKQVTVQKATFGASSPLAGSICCVLAHYFA